MNIFGTAGDDNLAGTAAQDIFNVGQGGDDIVSGGSGNDIFNFGAAFNSFDKIDGGTGSDSLKLNGDYSSGVEIHSNALTSVEHLTMAAGHSYHVTLDDGNIAAGTALNVSGAALSSTDVLFFEGGNVVVGKLDVTGGAGDDTLSGGAGDDSLQGGAGNDSFTVSGGHDLVDGGDGNDNVDIQSGSLQFTGGNGDDTLFLNGQFTLADTFDGGTGDNRFIVESTAGPLTARFHANTIVNVLTLNFEGDAANIRMNDGNLATGQTMFVRADELNTGASFRLDASAETDGSYNILCGDGGNTITGGGGADTIDLSNDDLSTLGGISVVHGGGGDDIITIVNAYTTHDKIDGGAGNDVFDFNVHKSGTIHFLDTSFFNIEIFSIDSSSANDSFVSADGNVAAGQTLEVDGSTGGNTQFYKFDGSAETDGRFHFFGDAGADTLIGGALGDTFYGAAGGDHLTGNGGNDVFVYDQAAESTGVSRDVITGFDTTHDKFDMLDSVSGIDATVASGRLSTASFDTDLAHVLGATHLAMGGAVIFTPTTGTLHGHTFLVVDANGTAGYQAGQDYVIELVTPVHLTGLGTANFT